jgi:hypothetical protein
MTPETPSQARSQERAQAPRAGFQTLWVQKQLKRLKARSEALKAQFIKPHEIL